MTKQDALDAIARDISRCRVCKTGTSGLSVPGEGNPDADLVFLGEAPGKKEAATGRPFIGRSGQLLRRQIRMSGIDESKVFITSPVKYLPDRGTPTATQIAHGRVHLEKQLAVIQPRYIVLLGKTACHAIFGKSIEILKEHGTLRREDGRTYLITLHPAAVLRFPKYASLFAKDFSLLMDLLHSS